MVLVRGTPIPTGHRTLPGASELRAQILAGGAPYVALIDLIALAWSLGIPVVHLRVFPWPQKRMAAMTANTGDRWAVMLGRDSLFPATLAFYLAHELGHIALGHLDAGEQIVDLDDGSPWGAPRDAEDVTADAFALELLTGYPELRVLPATPGQASARELARIATRNAAELQVEPGTLALGFGFSTGNWAIANAALNLVYGGGAPVWEEVNAFALRQLSLGELGAEAADFLRAVLGQAPA